MDLNKVTTPLDRILVLRMDEKTAAEVRPRVFSLHLPIAGVRNCINNYSFHIGHGFHIFFFMIIR